jgi:hypothetical protein
VLNKSILVVAHPDDEILWFSSILDRVGKVVFCYIDNASNPAWGPGRRKAISEFRGLDISCLNVDESEVFSKRNWYQPAYDEYGLKIVSNVGGARRYAKNYHELKDKLKTEIKGFRNIITHNPWGDYGNEEHVQVYQIIKVLQKENDANIWYSNYCSNKSATLMFDHIDGFNSEYSCYATNKVSAQKMMTIYRKNDCWTWYDNWVWFNEECFVLDNDDDNLHNRKLCGHLFPVNMIKLNFHVKQENKNSFLKSYKNSLRNLFGRRRN